jgi:hypothetical protein
MDSENKNIIQKNMDFVSNTQKEMIRVQLPIIIIRRISIIGFITGKGVIDFINKNYRMQISPGTVYSVLNKLEMRNVIEKLPGKMRHTYILTSNGEAILRIFNESL